LYRNKRRKVFLSRQIELLVGCGGWDQEANESYFKGQGAAQLP